MKQISLRVNGVECSVSVEDRKLLLDTIREEVGLTGTHAGCEHGVCGACTVLLNGEPVRSCLLFAVQAEGAEITTIEGVGGDDERPHPLQSAFVEHLGLQCGFCTSGMILTSLSLLEHNPRPSRDEIREAIAGNLCRCTGYKHIVDSVEHASMMMSGTDVEEGS